MSGSGIKSSRLQEENVAEIVGAATSIMAQNVLMSHYQIHNSWLAQTRAPLGQRWEFCGHACSWRAILQHCLQLLGSWGCH